MKERKVEGGPVDAERVVHELLDALETLAKKRRLTSSLAGERKGASTKVFASTGKVAGLGESEAGQIPAFESAKSSEPPGFEAQSSEDGVIQGFCRVHGVVERLQVTPQELQALADASLLGFLTCKEDVLFMLARFAEQEHPRNRRRALLPSKSGPDISSAKAGQTVTCSRTNRTKPGISNPHARIFRATSLLNPSSQ